MYNYFRVTGTILGNIALILTLNNHDKTLYQGELVV